MFNPTRGDTIAPELFFIVAVKFLFVTMNYMICSETFLAINLLIIKLKFLIELNEINMTKREC